MQNLMTTFFLGLLLTSAFVPPGFAALPGQFDDVETNGKVLAQVAKDMPPGKVGATLVCLNGLQFALGAMLGINAGTSAVSILQVYEAHQGRTRPATCTLR